MDWGVERSPTPCPTINIRLHYSPDIEVTIPKSPATSEFLSADSDSDNESSSSKTPCPSAIASTSANDSTTAKRGAEVQLEPEQVKKTFRPSEHARIIYKSTSSSLHMTRSRSKVLNDFSSESEETESDDQEQQEPKPVRKSRFQDFVNDLKAGVHECDQMLISKTADGRIVQVTTDANGNRNLTSNPITSFCTRRSFSKALFEQTYEIRRPAFRCPACQVWFKRFFALQNHLESEKHGKCKHFKCANCNKQLSTFQCASEHVGHCRKYILFATFFLLLTLTTSDSQCQRQGNRTRDQDRKRVRMNLFS